jgi:hypothetical protein
VSTICIQHGAPAYTNPGFRNWSFANVLVWGSQFVEPFAKYNPGQRFTAIGTPAAFGTPCLRTSEKITSVGFFLQKAAENIPQQEWREMMEFIAWTAHSFPDVTVIIREHPTQPRLDAQELATLGSPPNLRFMSPPEFKLNDALEACDVVVACASTTLFEAVVTGAVPFIFGTAFSPDFPPLAAQGVAVAAPDLEQAKTSMRRLMEDTEMRAGFRAQGRRLSPELFASYGQDGAVKIAGYLQAMGAKDAGARP